MSDILDRTQDYVVDLLRNNLDKKFLYHNLRHTQRVVKSTKEILESCSLSEKEKEILELVAWLHDTGYTEGIEDHEERSCDIAEKFLSAQDYDPKSIDKIKTCIRATKRNFEPTNVLEKIIRDADASHFAQISYLETSEFLREELKLLDVKNFSQEEWLECNIQMFRTEHRYYTDYAKGNWSEKKDENLRKLIREKKVA